MNIASSLRQSRLLAPDKTAIQSGDEQISYRQLDEAASRVANVVKQLGVREGSRVALCLPNTPAFVACYLGLQKIGAVAVSMSTSWRAAEAGFVLNDSQAVVLITTASLRHSEHLPVRGLPHLRCVLIAEGEAGGDLSLPALMAGASAEAALTDMPEAAPAAIVYTSGTTGVPKGAALSHGNVVFVMEAKKRYLDLRPEDRLLLFLPLFHCFGQNAVLNCGLHAGSTIVLQPSFDVASVRAVLAREQVSVLCAVPTAFILLHSQLTPVEAASVRLFLSAAAPLPPAVEETWFYKFGRHIHQGYGLTETSPFASYNDVPERKPGSLGRPIDGVRMRILDVDDGRSLGPGATGEIAIKGPNVMLGYWNRPADTEKVLREGWFRTGDIGYMDDEGYFFIHDRLKDMVNLGGHKVYPAEVEAVLYRHPAVAEAAVYGVPDPVLGESLRGAVILNPKATVDARALTTFCRQHLADFKVPADLEFVATLPRSPAGKVLKRVLREQCELATMRESLTATVDSPEHLEARIMDWLRTNLDLEPSSLDARGTFADFGMTSLLTVRLAADLSVWLGRTVEPTVGWRFPTIRSLAGHLAAPALAAPAPAPAVEDAPSQRHADIAQLSEAQAEAMLANELAELQTPSEEGPRRP